MAAPANISHARRGQATLVVEIVSSQSTVTSAFATNPMKLLTPRARGKSVWACTSSFGGGLVAGDETHLEVRLGPGARCYFGTQASTKIYRNPSLRPCSHTTHATVGAGSLLVFAPDPVQAFANSTYTQRQHFQLVPDASLLLVDWFTSGRANRGERWAFSHFFSRNSVWCNRNPVQDSEPECAIHAASGSDTNGSVNTANDEQFVAAVRRAPSPLNGERVGAKGETAAIDRNLELVFLDSLLLDPADGPLDSMHRTGRFNCFAMLLLLGPLLRDIAEALLADAAARPIQGRAPLVSSASPLRSGALVRVAGEQVEDVAHELHRHLAAVASLLGDDPWTRKW